MILNVIQNAKLPFYGVCSYGRSGSSYLMRLLNLAGVIVVGELPFEDRTIQAAMIAHLKLQMQVPRPVESYKSDCHQFYAQEFYRSSIVTNVNSVAELDTNYGNFLTAADTKGRLGIAEKFVGFDLMQIFKAYDDSGIVRPIFLMRDPRDIFVSLKEFNKKRGIGGFGDQGDDVGLFRGICSFSLWEKRNAARFGGLVCYYEDLMLGRTQSIVELLRYIGFSSVGRATVDTIMAGLRNVRGAEAHMTSETPQKSVARWMGDDYRSYHAMFEKFVPQLTELGYL